MTGENIMIKMYIKTLDKKLLTLLILALIAAGTICGKNTYTVCLIYSHFPCMYLNNIYLLLLYQQMDKFNSLHHLIITRVGNDKFYLYSYFLTISNALIYNIVIYVTYYFYFGSIPKETVSLTFFFMILNLVIACIENTIIYMQLGKKKQFIYLVLPIVINLLFHIIFTDLF